MRRVILLLSAAGLWVACDKGDYDYQQDPIYFANEITEVILPVNGTETKTTTYVFKYRGLGLVNYESVSSSTPSIRTALIVHETSYDGSFPKSTIHKRGEVKTGETVYNTYSSRGSVRKKTTTEVDSENLPIVEEYKYDGGRISEYSKAVKTATNTTVYTVVKYHFSTQNVLTAETSVQTETNGVKSTATTTLTDRYRLNYNETVQEHTHIENGVTRVTSYEYDGKTNPRYLQFSYRMTHPDFFLQEGYGRNNITKKTVKYPNISGQDYEEETSYSYFKGQYPLKAVIKRNNVEVGTREYKY